MIARNLHAVMAGTEWAIGAFSSEGQLERRQFLDDIVGAAFGEKLQERLALVGNPGATSPRKALPEGQE